MDTDIEPLLVAASNDPAEAPAFLAALLESTVLVPGTTAGDHTLNLADLLGPTGGSVQPFYTSEDRMRETLAAVPAFERNVLSLPCRTLFEVTRGATLVLNPHSSHGKEFLPGEVAQLLDGVAPFSTRIVEAETTVFVGQPAHVPDGMTDALATLLKQYPAVDQAVLGWKVTPQGDTTDTSYLLVIVGSPSVRDEINLDLRRALAVYSLVDPVDVMFAQPGERHLLHSVPPFYRRRRGLFGRR